MDRCTWAAAKGFRCALDEGHAGDEHVADMGEVQVTGDQLADRARELLAIVEEMAVTGASSAWESERWRLGAAIADWEELRA